MATTGQVHWHEGLFLQPHHLQTMQRHGFEQTVTERRLAWAYPYGLVESRVSADALENMLVQFDRLRLVMPSGAIIDVPEHADLPPLDIKGAYQSTSASFMVYIAIPVWYASRGNTQENSSPAASHATTQSNRLFRVAAIERPDENTGENPQPVLVRRLAARLLLDGDDRSDLEVVPLLRIAHSAGQDASVPRQDPNYIPACMVLRGSTALWELCRDIANHVEARRGQLLARIAREKLITDQLRGAQFVQLLKLRTLNHFSARLAHLVKAPSATPFQVYLEMRSMLGELAALRPDQDHSVVAEYDHDNPTVPFAELASKIRMLLPREGKLNVLQVPFNRADRLLVADLNDQHLKLPNDYFLAVKTKQEHAPLAQLVQDPDRFKLMSRSLARANIWGIKLIDTQDPPLQLPKPQGLHYFRMLLAETPSSVRMWEHVQREKSLVAKWPDMDGSDYELSLYMTVPESED
jgi:type VI secretion system ImpJ/VasE family protein